MSHVLSPCFYCKHFIPTNAGKYVCSAFPEGIPVDVITGDVHNEVIDGQEGAFVYTPKVGGPTADRLVTPGETR